MRACLYVKPWMSFILCRPHSVNFPVLQGKPRTKSNRSLFEDDDVLFGTPEDNPTVDLFGAGSPLTPTKVGVKINPLCAKFFRRNKNIYLHFMSFLHIDMTEEVEIIPQGRQELFCIVNIMGADVLSTQEATMILNVLNWINSVPSH